MNPHWKSTASYGVLAAIIALAYGGFCIHTGRQDAALAQNETSTSVHIHKGRSLGLTLCEYSYNKDASSTTTVEGKCPDRVSTGSGGGAMQDVADLPEDFTAIMYFDPADLDSYSFTELGAKSAHEYLLAKLSIGAGVIGIALLIWGTVYSSRPEQSVGGIVVDHKGTVLNPDAINSGQTEAPHYSYMDVLPKEQPDRSEKE